MSGLKSLRNLIQSMSPEERLAMRNFLTSFDSRGERFNSKSVKLFDFLSESTEDISERDVEFYIYGKRSTAAFSRLLIRFRDKLLESLLLDVNIKREGAYSHSFRYLFEVRKKLCYAQILIGRGQHELALFLYDSCFDLCEQYEFYDELLLAIRLKMQITSLLQGTSELDKLLALYAKWEDCRTASLAAYTAYNRIVASKTLHARGQQTHDEIKQLLFRLQVDYERTGSASVAFYMYYIEAEFLQVNQNYRQARKVLQRQANLIEKSVALAVPYRLGNVLINQADNELYLHQFDRCVDFCQRALPMLKKNSFNEYQCLETEFYGHFYAGRYTVAREIIRDLLDRDSGKRAELREGRRHYLLACILFMQEMYREAQELLLELNAIEADREGWNVGIRLLIIQTDIERTLHDQAGKRIENVRKHLRRLEQADKARKRDVLIYEVLRALDNASYDFRAVYQTMAGHFDLLRSQEEDCRWEIHSPELILFHEWFFAHVIRTKYVQKIPKYIEPTADDVVVL